MEEEEEILDYCQIIDLPLDSNKQQCILNSKYEALRSVISEERCAATFKHLLEAQWIPCMRLAQVTKKAGNHLMTMGQDQNQSTFLKAEEALFLLERASLVLKVHECCLSLQQAYTLLLNEEDISLEAYLVG
jgi:hypothetical protein